MGPLSCLPMPAGLNLHPLCRQDLPPAENAGWPSQFFAIVIAIFGLASFALVLALIEQVDMGCRMMGLLAWGFTGICWHLI